MSPMADGANLPAAAADAKAVQAEQLLGSGEVVILALRPSGWFILFVSFPVLLVFSLLLAAALITEGLPGVPVSRDVAISICLLAAGLRLAVALAQWTSRLYVLTNLRVLRVRGLVRVDVFQLPLKKIAQAQVLVTMLDRPLGLGSLFFQTVEGRHEGDWICLSRPLEVQQIVQDAIRRAR